MMERCDFGPCPPFLSCLRRAAADFGAGYLWITVTLATGLAGLLAWGLVELVAGWAAGGTAHLLVSASGLDPVAGLGRLAVLAGGRLLGRVAGWLLSGLFWPLAMGLFALMALLFLGGYGDRVEARHYGRVVGRRPSLARHLVAAGKWLLLGLMLELLTLPLLLLPLFGDLVGRSVGAFAVAMLLFELAARRRLPGPGWRQFKARHRGTMALYALGLAVVQAVALVVAGMAAGLTLLGPLAAVAAAVAVTVMGLSATFLAFGFAIHLVHGLTAQPE